MTIEFSVPYRRMPGNSVPPGSLVQIEMNGHLALAMMCVWSTGDLNYLILDGDAAGEVTYTTPISQLVLNEDVILKLPRRAGTYSQNKPNSALSVAFDDTKCYFVFQDSGTSCYVNIGDGLITINLKGITYVRTWEICTKDIKGPDGLIAKSND